MKKFPNIRQHDQMDCGPTCLRIITRHYGKRISQHSLTELVETNRIGSNLSIISQAAEKIGFRTMGVRIDFNKLKNEAPLPCIVHWNSNHFVVVYKIKKEKVYISDPAFGLISYSKKEFLKNWYSGDQGIVLLLEPTPKFYNSTISNNYEDKKKFGFGYLLRYIKQFKNLIIQLIIGLLVGSVLQIAFPFLTQSVVDTGIKNQDIDFIYLILLAQLMLFLGKTAVEVIRRWILLHLSTRLNISTVSDFFIKLMNLPISFFDKRMTGDLMQRINDHKRLERLITTTSLNTLFSLVTLFVFSLILAYYDRWIFMIFSLGTIFYFIWVFLFLKKRKILDHKNFNEVSTEQSKIIELINGMQEIKLHNAERKMRWGWENVQINLFNISVKRLSLEQVQTVGSTFINEIKNILITFIAAQQVIQGEMTLGMMLAVSYILGQLNTPIVQLVDFIYSYQDAKISIDRLSEIHAREDEENRDKTFITDYTGDEDITINNLSFRYPGTNDLVLNDVNLKITSNKVTAIVGLSGSGKTTLMKLLLGFYKPTSGNIRIGKMNIENISTEQWRRFCGVVMQEGHIFNTSFEENIALGEEVIDRKRLVFSCEMSNIKDFIETKPSAYKTKIGAEGIGLSTGQKQRVLLARAIYKDPKLFFLDEATSALDANNEKIIMQNLNQFFVNRTSVIIAHRLSTVKNADQIVVLNDGKIVETGSHEQLIANRSAYYNLVKNQLQLEKLRDYSPDKEVSMA